MWSEFGLNFGLNLEVRFLQKPYILGFERSEWSEFGLNFSLSLV